MSAAAGGAFLINAGRGQLQFDVDIITALDDIAPAVFARHVVEQIERFERGLPLEHAVDRSRGY